MDGETNFDGATRTFSSAWSVNSSVDPNYLNEDQWNTGWDLYQPNSSGLMDLSLNVNNIAGDGIGFTLGYRICSNLLGVGANYTSPIGPQSLYDVDPIAGRAVNPRTTGLVYWRVAFSPVSPTGTLYGLDYSGSLWKSRSGHRGENESRN